MVVPEAVKQLSDDEGLTLLELLAHNLTIAVRMAAGSRQPEGPRTDEEARLAMYWINEALHNVVQLTRELRLKPEVWTSRTISNWFAHWLSYKHGQKEIEWAVEHSLWELESVTD